MSTIIGITGGIGSGKSAVAEGFRRLDVEVFDADDLAREVVAPGEEALATIAARFGPRTLGPDGALDRAWMRQRVFADARQRRWLEELLHPLIQTRLASRLERAAGDYAMLESALLTRSGQRELAHRILLIDAPETLRLERVRQRDGAAATAREIMAAQPTRSEFLAAADDVIDNSGSEAALWPQIEALHRLYRTLKA